MAGRKENAWRAQLAFGLCLLSATCWGATGALSCALKAAARHTVAAVVDAQTLRLDDGRELHLADIRPPRASDVALHGAADGGSHEARERIASTPWPLEQAVIAALSSRLVGTTVSLAFDKAPDARLPDRYGRLRAHVLIDGQQSDGGWLQADLVARGLVRLEFRPGEAPCLSALAALERTARRNRTGLWQHAAYESRDAAKSFVLRGLAGTLQAVEGTVASVSTTRGRTYLNFGPDRRRDFTASMRASQARELAAAGTDLTALKGKRVRVTGWLEVRGGPWLEIEHAAQLEVLDRGDAAADAGRGGTTARRLPESRTPGR